MLDWWFLCGSINYAIDTAAIFRPYQCDDTKLDALFVDAVGL
jgi:hypothetical protein